MYLYVYKSSRQELEDALNKLKINYDTKFKKDYYNGGCTHKFHKNNLKKLTKYLLETKNYNLSISSKSCWIDEVEKQAKSYCVICKCLIKNYGKSYITKCYQCYKMT